MGVLQLIENNAELFRKLFTYHEDDITAEKVKRILKFDACSNEVTQHFLKYITSLKKNGLEDFIKFVTGATILPSLITVKMEESDGIFASTCAREITVPTNVADYGQFIQLLNLVIKTSAQKFTSV